MANALLSWFHMMRARPVAKVATRKRSRKEVIAETNKRSDSLYSSLVDANLNPDMSGADLLDTES